MRMNVIIGTLALSMLCGGTSALWVTPTAISFRNEIIVRHSHQNRCSGDDRQNEVVGDPNTTPNNRETCAVFSKESNVIGRRHFTRGLIMSSIFKSAAARADESSTLLSTRPSATPNAAIKPAICDPTVESYRKGSNQIHVVGTAHISSVSSQLSGASVRETKPDAVFLELDLQRLARAFRNGQVNKPITILFFTGENSSGGGRVQLRSAVLAPQNLQKESRGLGRLLEKMALKNPIQEMYEGLEAQGITPGEEFITAVEEGANLNSLIILGDRRMDITMRRLANALVFHTDPQKMMEADQIITSKLKARIPEISQLEETLKREKRELSSDELASFVEKMKTKETTEEMMMVMQKAAPELHQALVGERDVFMARGMDSVVTSSLASALPPPSLSAAPSSVQTMVAVIGLGHMSGVGKELTSLGWSKFKPSKC